MMRYGFLVSGVIFQLCLDLFKAFPKKNCLPGRITAGRIQMTPRADNAPGGHTLGCSALLSQMTLP